MVDSRGIMSLYHGYYIYCPFTVLSVTQSYTNQYFCSTIVQNLLDA